MYISRYYVLKNPAVLAQKFYRPCMLLKICVVLGIDLGYYWFHRASHEVGLLWAVHQVTASS
jgi:sterol desaturase/sphingolipid hydroxylase (fatty acid hydroxylase superfamily)